MQNHHLRLPQKAKIDLMKAAWLARFRLTDPDFCRFDFRIL